MMINWEEGNTDNLGFIEDEGDDLGKNVYGLL